ncbi:MAG: RnfABCDGE type electron transport complex subunit D [Deltaproteobacteria bacterium]|nr:RnfABCDGE type electron transport complex subunit D [Deltaproteobacteria bacterium]
MHTVVLSLVPALVAAVVFFGWRALVLTVVSVAACLAVEASVLRMAGKPVKGALVDGSAIITGLLLAMNLPSNLPFWMVVVGAIVAIAVAKHAYGGLGNNPFNPALVARVFMLIAFPGAMTSWPVTTWNATADVMTAATPLGVMKMEGAAAAVQSASWWDLFIGNVGGCLGETSALALLVGGLFLLWRKVISWHIPVAFIGTVAVGTAIAWAADPAKFPDPLWHVLSGGVMLGAWFMATDMVTSPVTRRGMLIFGAGCGIVTCVIRLLGAYPEGVSFSILIMNGLTPLIDRYVKPSRFGIQKAQAEGSKP